MNKPTIPVSRPLIAKDAFSTLKKAFDSGWLSGSGPYVEKFEAQWAGTCGRKYGVAVCNGTAALETAVFAMDLPKGSEIIIPAFTIMSCLAAALRNGLKPVLVDADPVTWCMDPCQVGNSITRRTSAVMPVHIYGHPVNMQRVMRIAGKAGVKVVEDAAEAHGALCNGRMCGSFGDASAFSFYANKLVACGEGGMVLTDSLKLAERCRKYRNLYFGGVSRFVHDELGCNYRLSNLLAAIGFAQAKVWKNNLRRKQKIAGLYNELLRDIPDIQLPAVPGYGTNSYWVYGVVIGRSRRLNAEDVIRRLKKQGIESRPFFRGMHQQPVYRKLGLKSGKYPVTEYLSVHGLYLPSGAGNTDEEILRSAEAFKKCLC